MSVPTTIPLPRRGRAQWSVGVPIFAWLAAIALGWCYLASHEFSTNPSFANGGVDHWPSATTIVREEGRPTLVLFLHPKCPCSRATLRELERMFASSPADAPHLVVVATVPESASNDWWDTDTMATSQRLPNAELFVDRDGIQAATFGATTSGQLMLFDASGNRQFAGGVTLSRGHEGVNLGSDRLAELLHGEPSQHNEIPAFGCRLCLPEETSPHELSQPAITGGEEPDA